MSSEPQPVKTEYTEDGLVTGYYCPQCSEKIDLHHTDDIGTKFFHCPKCDKYFTKFKTEERVKLDEAIKKLEDIHKTTTVEELSKILSTTIKRDDKNKVITFLSMILTYTDSDQTNIGFNSESSTGKSYIPLELSWYFPKEDVLKYSYVSPTAFFHEAGVLLPDPSEPQPEPSENPEEQKEYEKKRRKIIWIDLKQKILIFLDQPHDQLLQRLRPLLSHDERVLVHQITDRSKRGSLVTKKVWIQGFPSVIFCTAKFNMNDQERTRLILLSPETTKEKIREAIKLKIEKDADKDAFQKDMESDPFRVWLKNRVEDIKQAQIKNIVFPEGFKQKILDRFLNEHENLIPRYQRDVGRLIAMIKAHALLNLWSRERKDENIIATETDVDEGFKIYEEVAKSNEIGLPPEVYNIFIEIAPKIPDEGITRRDFSRIYYESFHRVLGKKRLEEVLNLIFSVGLITEEPDPNDHRQKRLLLTGRGVFNFGTQKELETVKKINTPEGESNTKFSIDQIKAIKPLEDPKTGVCAFCGKGSLDMVSYPKTSLTYQVETFKKEIFFVCEDCGQKIKKGMRFER